jgi:hypothetical protein
MRTKIFLLVIGGSFIMGNGGTFGAEDKYEFGLRSSEADRVYPPWETIRFGSIQVAKPWVDPLEIVISERPNLMVDPRNTKWFKVPDIEPSIMFKPAGSLASEFRDLEKMAARYYPTARPFNFSIGDADETNRRQPTDFPEIFISSGWQSADVYKGIDKTSEAGLPIKGDPTADDVKRTPIWFDKAGFGYIGFAGSITYLESFDRITPRFASIQRLMNGTAPLSETYYQELDLSLSYTYGLIKNRLEATAGYNAFILPDRDFWGTNYAGEVYGRLTWDLTDHILPNVTYSHFHSGAQQLRHGYLELRIDTQSLRLLDTGKLMIEVNPYVSVGVDNSLIGDGTDWSVAELGVRIPVTIGRHLRVIGNLNYGIPINDSDNNFRTDASKVGIWGGVSLSIDF